jgi:hypothetical protein
MSLKDLIGEHILVSFVGDKTAQLFDVKLHGVEAGGIWIERHDVAQALLTLTKMSVSKMPLFFYPYSQIACICIGSEDLTAVSEKSFGV